ncbi:MAG: hypothetical protein RLZZ227_155, partial [Pseudomonadota bacterium]
MSTPSIAQGRVPAGTRANTPSIRSRQHA